MALILKKSKVRRLEANRENAQELTRKAIEFPTGTSTKDREFIENRINVPIHKFKDLESYLNAGCLNVWASFRACHIVASVVTSTTFKLMRQDQLIEGGAAYDLWNNPNHWDSLSELIYQWVFHMKLTGRAYWVKDEMNSLGQPTCLYPLLPQHVILHPDRKLGVKEYVYRVNGNELSFNDQEIIFFRRPHPMDPLQGLGDIEPSQSLYNEFINRNVYEERFLENGAQPSGILTYKGSDEMPASMSDMEDEEWGNLKKWWSAEYSGKKNAGKTAMLSGEWHYERLGLTQQEMATIERDNSSIQQIFMNHGVPLSLAGWTNAANYATARQDEINFRKYEVVPLINILVDKLNSNGVLFSNFDEQTKLTYEISGLIDVEQVHKDYLPLFQAGGMSLNELRSMMGLEKITEDDVLFEQYYGTNAMVPLEMIGGNNVESLEAEVESLVPEDSVDVEPEEADDDSTIEPVQGDDNASPEVSLNGAQITAIVNIALAVTEGALPKDTAVQIVAASFPFDEERSARIFQSILDQQQADEEPQEEEEREFTVGEVRENPNCPDGFEHYMGDGSWMCGREHMGGDVADEVDADKGYGKPKDDEDEDKKVTEAVREGLKNKVDEHNEKVGNAKTKRTNLRTLIAVFNRGIGAYNTNPESVRPSVSSAEQWAYARVNSFLYALRNGKFRGGKHDTDLLPEGHPQSSKGYYEDEDKDKRGLPDKYRPATEGDVPEGRACGNCIHFDEDDVAPDGRARCKFWGEYVEGGYYCDAWEPLEDSEILASSKIREARLETVDEAEAGNAEEEGGADKYYVSVDDEDDEEDKGRGRYRDDDDDDEDKPRRRRRRRRRVNLADDEDKDHHDEEEENRKDEVKRRKPPQGAISSYRDGIRRHENGETGDGMEPITIRMAKDFIAGAMPTDEWTAKANRWWGRNERFLDEPKGGAAYAAAQLWGGRSGSSYWKSEARRRGLVE